MKNSFMVDNRTVPTQDKPATRTERQRERTRRQLLDAGRTLIASKGVPGLRIQEITEQATSRSVRSTTTSLPKKSSWKR